ncbi:MAG: cysteine desulfurase [Planctomycetaceae bacterium]|nr:cysteine desulfurase [Planctomycetaceae bacterium]
MIDLDHNATTRVRDEALAAMDRAWRTAGGNPGSRHALGRRARQVLEEAREQIAAILNAAPTEVIFTGGGTEAINLALQGLAVGRPGTIALTPGEHPATEESVRALQQRGWQRSEIAIDASGRMVPDRLSQLPWDEIRLATVLLAHNETGVIQDIAPLAQHCRERRIPLHVDAVQAVGKIDVDFQALGATALSIAAHKFHGPRGIGALLLREGVRLSPLLYGGHQESGRRPGTECAPLAAGMATALQLWHETREQSTRQVSRLRDQLAAGLAEQCRPIVVHGSLGHRLPNTLSVAFPGCDGDALLVALDLEGVCCSLGSTCASGSSEPAPILTAMGVPPAVARSTLRLSLGIDNTAQEIATAVQTISGIVARLRKTSGNNRADA